MKMNRIVIIVILIIQYVCLFLVSFNHDFTKIDLIRL